MATGQEVYVIAGSYGRGGTGTNGFATTLDNGRVTVPARCWKVVVILPTGAADATRVTAGTRVIAIDIPNDNALNLNWGTYRTSVDAIEAATGLDLLSAVPPATQQTIEARTDTGPTNYAHRLARRFAAIPRAKSTKTKTSGPSGPLVCAVALVATSLVAVGHQVRCLLCNGHPRPVIH